MVDRFLATYGYLGTKLKRFHIIAGHGGSTDALSFRIEGPQGGQCKTFPQSIHNIGTARFEDVRCDGSL